MPSPLDSPFVLWIAGAAGTLFLSALAALAIRDRNGIDKDLEGQNRRLNVLETSVTALVAAQAAAQAGSAAQWAEVLRRLGSIESDVKHISARSTR
jgi:hypothetical protein